MNGAERAPSVIAARNYTSDKPSETLDSLFPGGTRWTRVSKRPPARGNTYSSRLVQPNVSEHDSREPFPNLIGEPQLIPVTSPASRRLLTFSGELTVEGVSKPYSFQTS
jgi:hypothetical protein